MMTQPSAPEKPLGPRRRSTSRCRRRAAPLWPTNLAPSDIDHQGLDAFLAASRGGDFDALLAVLDPDVVLRSDRAAMLAGTSTEVRGAAAVAETFGGRARAAQPALVNGAVGLVWAPGGRPRVVFAFTITHGKVVEIEMVAEPDRVRQLDLAILDG
jgi:RNA polymerase sigma-70 factor (ECF subfamily)